MGCAAVWGSTRAGSRACCAATTSARRMCGSIERARKGYGVEDFDDAWARYAPQSTPADEREKREVREDPPAEPKDPRGNLADDAAIREVSARLISPQERDLADLADGNGRVAARTIELAEPACSDTRHRGRDWAMPDAAVWICGVCHPPAPALQRYPLVYRSEVAP